MHFLFATVISSLTDDGNCTSNASTTTLSIVQQYGDLSGKNTYTINALCCDCGSNHESFEISGSSSIVPLLKMWAIEYNLCLKYGCATITISSGESHDGAADVCSKKSNIGAMIRDWNTLTEGTSITTLF